MAHWTFRETPDCKKSKRSFYWAARRRHTARSAPLKAFKLILVSLTAFLFLFFFFCTQSSCTHLGFFPTLAVRLFSSIRFMDSCKLWVGTPNMAHWPVSSHTASAVVTLRDLKVSRERCQRSITRAISEILYSELISSWVSV